MDVQEYLVTLGVRPAEMSGLKELPGSTKDRLTPLILLAPWLATTPLSRALDKFQEFYTSRPYFVDVDTHYQINDNLNEAKTLWKRLAGKPADLAAWWQLLSGYPRANPCLLLAEQTIGNGLRQIEWAREKNRTFCLRMNLDPSIGSGIPPWMPDLVTQLAEEGANDYAVVFEFGWVDDPLQVAAIASGYTNSFFSKIPPEVPVAVSCTSFPKAFTDYDGIHECAFTNRDLVTQVRRATNHPRIIYADWCTTRPRSYGRANAPKVRIDYPTDTAWVIARDQDDQVSFQEACTEDHWQSALVRDTRNLG